MDRSVRNEFIELTLSQYDIIERVYLTEFDGGQLLVFQDDKPRESEGQKGAQSALIKSGQIEQKTLITESITISEGN